MFADYSKKKEPDPDISNGPRRLATAVALAVLVAAAAVALAEAGDAQVAVKRDYRRHGGAAPAPRAYDEVQEGLEQVDARRERVLRRAAVGGIERLAQSPVRL